MMKPGCRLLDMCTGSGCIVLSLAKLGTVTWGIGADISEEALKVAERNRENLGLSQVKLVHSDLFGSCLLYTSFTLARKTEREKGLVM